MSLNNLNIIYKISFKNDSKVYIGQTTRYEDRTKEHLKCISTNKHKNKQLVDQKIQEHGDKNTFIEIVEILNNVLDLNAREIYWINFYNSFYDGYNQTSGGTHWYPGIDPDDIILTQPRIFSPESYRKGHETKERLYTNADGSLFYSEITEKYYRRKDHMEREERRLYKYPTGIGKCFYSFITKKYYKNLEDANRDDKFIKDIQSGKYSELQQKHKDIMKVLKIVKERDTKNKLIEQYPEKYKKMFRDISDKNKETRKELYEAKDGEIFHSEITGKDYVRLDIMHSCESYYLNKLENPEKYSKNRKIAVEKSKETRGKRKMNKKNKKDIKKND